MPMSHPSSETHRELVTLERVIETLGALNEAAVVCEEDAVYLDTTHIADYVGADPGFCNVKITLVDDLLRVELRPHFPIRDSRLETVADFVNTWNHSYLAPHVHMRPHTLEAIFLSARTDIPVSGGMSPLELRTAMEQALANNLMFAETLTEAFSETRVRPFAPPQEEAAWAKVEEDVFLTAPADDPALEVTLDRVKKTLFHIGVTRVDIINDASVICHINGVPFAFHLETGPKLAVKGVWNANGNPEDFLRIFMVCNAHNASLPTGCAYCHRNADGVQVQIDVNAPIEFGLTDAQLNERLGRAIKAILRGIDAIAKEASGESPVRWA